MAFNRRASDRSNPSIDDARVTSVGRNVILAFIVTTALVAAVPLVIEYPMLEYPNDRYRDFAEAVSERASLYLQLWSIMLPALIAFFGFYRARGDMRDAIAGSFVVAFLVVLVESVILSLGLFANTEGSLRAVAVSNFMTLVGTIVIFYFGSEAAIRVGGQWADAKAAAARSQAEGRTTPEPDGN